MKEFYKMRNIIIGLIILVATVLVYWLFLKKENPQNYLNEITLHRYERAEFFKYSPDSPFIQQKENFSYLDYYPANQKLNILADFKQSNSADTVNLATSTGTIDKFIAFGSANFNLDGDNNSLLVLRSLNPNDPSLFIPYLDKTSGNTTYGSGRYLDVEKPSRNRIRIDFNKAYNPYCAYTDRYTCPFPPKENRLTIAIEAGEKSYPSH